MVKLIHVEHPKPEGAVPWLCPSNFMLIQPCIILSGEVMVLLPFLLFFLAIFVPQRSPLVIPPFFPLVSIFPYFIFLLYFSSPSYLLILLPNAPNILLSLLARGVLWGDVLLRVSTTRFRSAFPPHLPYGTIGKIQGALWKPISDILIISGKPHRKQKAKQGHGHLNGNAEQVVNWRNKLQSAAINLNSP